MLAAYRQPVEFSPSDKLDGPTHFCQNARMSDSAPLAKGEGDYGVLLPCTPETFSDFISGLLGKPQRIERRFWGEFVFTREDLESTFHLVDQRVRQQNEASLLQFTIEIRYSDDSSVLLNSFSDFQTYTEVRPLVSTGCVLAWTYLIRFRDRNVPEKQTVELAIGGGQDIPGIFGVRSPRLSGDGVSFRIEHTARTWGADLEALLAGHVEHFRQAESGVRRFVHTHSGKVGLSVTALFLVTIMSGAYFVTRAFSNSQLEGAVVATRTADLSAKVDFIIERFSAGSWTQYNFALTVFLMLSFVGALVIGVWTSESAERPEYTFVLLTKASESRREKILRGRERRWLTFMMSVIGALLLGVASNYLFAALVKNFS